MSLEIKGKIERLGRSTSKRKNVAERVTKSTNTWLQSLN